MLCSDCDCVVWALVEWNGEEDGVQWSGVATMPELSSHVRLSL